MCRECKTRHSFKLRFLIIPNQIISDLLDITYIGYLSFYGYKAKISIIFFIFIDLSNKYFQKNICLNLTLSTHCRYRKLVRFHHKLVPYSSQFCTVLFQKSHKQPIYVTILLFFFSTETLLICLCMCV